MWVSCCTQNNEAVRFRPCFFFFFLSSWLRSLALLARHRQLPNKFTRFYSQTHNSSHPSGRPGVSARQRCLHDGGMEGELDSLLFQSTVVMLIWALPETTAQYEVLPQHNTHTHSQWTQIFNTSQCQTAGVWWDSGSQKDQGKKSGYHVYFWMSILVMSWF